MTTDKCERCNQGEQHVYCCHNCEKFAAEIAVLSIEKRDLKAAYDEQMKSGLELDSQRDAANLQVREMRPVIEALDKWWNTKHEDARAGWAPVIEALNAYRQTRLQPDVAQKPKGECLCDLPHGTHANRCPALTDVVEKRNCEHCGQKPGWPHSPGCKNEPQSAKFR
jgi:hypothetical protein